VLVPAPPGDMNSSTIPGTPLVVSNVAYGCMNIGGGWDGAPLTQRQRHDAFDAIGAAIEAGITLFDHADIYCRGKSEEIFGSYLREHPSLRDRITIQSKCGIRFGGDPEPGSPHRYDLSRDHIIASVDEILGRLGVDVLDILLLHRPDPLCEPDEVASAFDNLHQGGKVKFFGVSNHGVGQMELLSKSLRQPIVVNQLQLSLGQAALITEGIHVNQDRGLPGSLASGIIDYCRMKGILVQAWGPVGAGSFLPSNDSGEKSLLSGTLRALAEQHGVAPETIAIAWLLRHPARIQPVIGSVRPKRIAALAAGDSVVLSREEWWSLLSAALGGKIP